MHNNTTNFVLPILMEDEVFQDFVVTRKNPFQVMKKFGFKDAYLNDNLNPEKNCIFLLFAPETIDDQFIQFCEQVLQKHEDYLKDYDTDNGEIMYVFKIPTEYLEDVHLLQIGKYSLTSKKFKKLFPQKITNKNGELVLHPNWMILHKHPDWKKRMETNLGVEIPPENDLWDPFNEEKEIFNYEKELIT